MMKSIYTFVKSAVLRVFIPVSAILMLLCFGRTAFAAGSSRLTDNAGLLSAAQRTELCSKLDEISQRQQFDVVVVTVNSLDGKSPMEYADDWYDYNGWGFGSGKDGALLLVSMEARDWWVSTCGFGITAVTDAGLDYMSDKFLPYLSDGDYYEAFDKFASLCDSFVTQARTGSAYDRGNMPKSPYPLAVFILISVGAGFVTSLICVSVMKGKLKSVRLQAYANNYVKSGSVSITDSRDMYLYSAVSKRPRPQQTTGVGGSSTHTSSSGGFHGGGGGKF